MNKTKPASSAAGPPSSTVAPAVENAKKPASRAPPTLAPRPTATSLLRASPHVALATNNKTSASALPGDAQQPPQASAPGGRAPAARTFVAASNKASAVMGIPQQPSASGRSMIGRSKVARMPPPPSSAAIAASTGTTTGTGRAAGAVPASPARASANRATAANRAPASSGAKPAFSSPTATTGEARFPSAMPAKSPGGARPGVGASSSLSVSTLTTRSPGGSISSKESISGLSVHSSSSTASKSSPVITPAVSSASAANRAGSTAGSVRRPATTPSTGGSTAASKASNAKTPTAAGRATSAPRPLVSTRSSSAGANTVGGRGTAARATVTTSATRARTPSVGIANSNSTAARTPIAANKASNNSSGAAKTAAARARTPGATSSNSTAARTPSANAAGGAAVTTPANSRSAAGKTVPGTRATLMRSNANHNNVVISNASSVGNTRSGVNAVRPSSSTASAPGVRTPSVTKTPVSTSSSAPGRARGVATTNAGAGAVNTPKTPFAASSARSTGKTGAGVSASIATPSSAVAANAASVSANSTNNNNNTNNATKRAALSPLARTLSPPSLLSSPEREKDRVIYSPSVLGGGGTGGRLSRTNSSQPERETERKGLFFSPSSPSSPVRKAPENNNTNVINTPTGWSSMRMETPLVSQIVFDTSISRSSAAAAAMLEERDGEEEEESDDDSLQEEDLIIINDDLMLASIDELASSLSTRSLSAANNDSSSVVKGTVATSSGKTDKENASSAVSETETDSLTTHAQTQVSPEKEKEQEAFVLPAAEEKKENEREEDVQSSELDSGVNESKPAPEEPSSAAVVAFKEKEEETGDHFKEVHKQENKGEERSSSSETESETDEFSSSSSAFASHNNVSEDSMPAMGNVARMRQRFALERNPAAPPTIFLHKGELELIRSHRISVKIVDITKQIAESQYNKEKDAITALRIERIQREAAEKETSESEEDPVSVGSAAHQQSRLLKNKFVEDDIKKVHSAASSPPQFPIPFIAAHAPTTPAHNAVVQPKPVSAKSDLSHRALPSVPVLASQRSAFSRNSSDPSTHNSAKKAVGQFAPSRENSNSSVNNVVVVSSSSSDSHAGGITRSVMREEESEGKAAAVSAVSASSPSVPVSVSSSREEASGVTASSSTLTAAAASSVEREREEREFSSISACADLGHTHTHTDTATMLAPTAASAAIRSPPAFSHTSSPPRILNPTPSKLRTQGFSPIVISPGPARAHPLLQSKVQHSQSFESSSGTVSELSGTSFLSGLSDTHTHTTATAETDAEPVCAVPRLNLQRHHLLLMEEDGEKSTTEEMKDGGEGEGSVFDALSKSTLSSSVAGAGLVTAMELSLSPGRVNAQTSTDDYSSSNQGDIGRHRQLSPSPVSPSQSQTETDSLLPAVVPPPVTQRHLSVGEMSRLTDDDLFSQMDEQASVGIAERPINARNNARSPREQQRMRVSFSPIIPPDALSGESSPSNARAPQLTHVRAHTHAHTLSQRQRERERETQQLEAEAERERDPEAFSHAQTYPAPAEAKPSEVSRYTRGHRMLQHYRKFDSERADHELTPLTRELREMLPFIASALASTGDRSAERSRSSDRSPRLLSSSSSSSHCLTPLSPLTHSALQVPRAFIESVCEQWRCAHLQVATTETGVVLVAVLPLLEELEISLTPGGLLGRGLWQLQKKLAKPWHSSKAESASLPGSASVDSHNTYTQAQGLSQSLSMSASVDDDASVFSHTQRTHTNTSTVSTANTCVCGGSVCVCDNPHGLCENTNLCESGVKEHCGRYTYSLDDTTQDCESATRLFLLRERERKREKRERRLSLTSMRFLPSFHSSRRHSSSQSYASPVASPSSPHHPLSREGLRSRVNERMTEEREKNSNSTPDTPTNMGEKAEEKEGEKERESFVFFPQERVRDRERAHPPLALDGIEEREEEKHQIEENPLFRHRRGISAADANNNSNNTNSSNTNNPNATKSKSYSAVKVCIVAKRYVFPQEREKDPAHSHSSRSGPTLEEKELRSEFNLAHWHASLCVARHVFHAYDKRTGVLAIFLDSSAVTASDFHTQKHKENHNDSSNNNNTWGVGFFAHTLSAALGVGSNSSENNNNNKKRKKGTRTPVDDDDDEESVRSRTHTHGHNRSHAQHKRRSATSSSSSSLAGTHSHAHTHTDDVEVIVRKGRYYFPADSESQRHSAAAQEVVPLTFTRSDTHTHAHKHAHALSPVQQGHTPHTAHNESQSPVSDAEPSLSPSLRIASKRQAYSHSYDSDSVHSSRSQRTLTHTHSNANHNTFASSSNSKRDSQDSLRNRTFPRGFTDDRDRERDKERERDLAQRLSGNGSVSSAGSSGEREKDRERCRFSLDIEDRTTSPFQAVKGKKKTPQLRRHGSDGTLGSGGSGSETSSSHHT